MKYCWLIGLLLALMISIPAWSLDEDMMDPSVSENMPTAATVRSPGLQSSPGKTSDAVSGDVESLPSLEVPEASVVETFGGSFSTESGGEQTFNSGDSFKVTNAGRSTERPSGPDIYEIILGDTLWDVCSKILGDPWYWPHLWSLNQYITNPHLIYPGNRLVFFSGSATQFPRMDLISQQDAVPQYGSGDTVVSATTDKEEFIVERSVHGSGGLSEVRLRPITFVAEKQLKPVGKITHSGVPKTELTYGDTVYLKLFGRSKPAVGNRFHVVEKLSRLKDGRSRSRLNGWMVRKNAVVEIRRILPETIEGVVVSGDYAVRRGDELIVYQPEIRTIQPSRSNLHLQAQIIGAENQQILISHNDFVFIDRGRKDGIKDGLELFVVKRGDGVYLDHDRHLPEVVKGKLIVVETFDQSATAYVTDLLESLVVGDTVRTVLK